MESVQAQPWHLVSRRQRGGRHHLITVALVAGLLPGATVVAQTAAPPLDEKAVEQASSIPFGAEIALRSGHADRGFLINDRPVLQPVVWATARGADLSLWGSFPLATTTDGARPMILEAEGTREVAWGRLSVAPAVRIYYYRDPVNSYGVHSIESWVYLSVEAGPLRLFSNHSVDIATFRGAYFGEAGVEAKRELAGGGELGGSASMGWASGAFTAVYTDVAAPGLERVGVEAWLTRQVNSRFYIGPHLEFSRIVHPELRTQMQRPTYLLVRLATGVEF
jgi:hypothetical protein